MFDILLFIAYRNIIQRRKHVHMHSEIIGKKKHRRQVELFLLDQHEKIDGHVKSDMRNLIN